MKIKVLFNVILVRLGFRKLLPKEAIRNVIVKECSEKIISLPETDFVISNKNQNICGRKTVIEKIIDINEQLKPQNYKICVFEIYRDEATQNNLRLQEYNNAKKEYPNYSEIDIEKIVDTRVAKIRNNNVGGHQTGGAIDLTICGIGEKELDMGTKYLEFNDKTKTYCKGLTQEQQNNRNLLLKLMKNANFVNYPYEWWHFSYGDTMWAAYKNNTFLSIFKKKKKAIYGKINVEN